jgi:hypothetical protein
MLNAAFENSGGTAERMANQQLKTLDSRLLLLGSAWDGLILKINNGDGALGKFMKTVIDATTSIVEFVSGGSDAISEYEKLNETFKQNNAEIELMRGRLRDKNITEKETIEIYNKLNKISPILTDGLKIESLNYESLSDNLKIYNENANKKLFVDKNIVNLEKAKAKLQESIISRQEEEKKATLFINNLLKTELKGRRDLEEQINSGNLSLREQLDLVRENAKDNAV